MDYQDNNTAPRRRRPPQSGAAGSGKTQSASAQGTAPRINATPAGVRKGEYTSRVGARRTSGASAPEVRTAARPAASDRSRTGDYRSRVQPRSASSSAGGSGSPVSVSVRPARPSASKSSGGQARPRTAPRSQGAGVRHTKRPRNPRWATALVCVCAVALLGVGYVGFNEVGNYMDYLNKCAELEQDSFYQGITLEGEPLGGLTLLEAVDRFQKKISNVAATTSITITARGKTYTLDSSNVQMSTNLQSTLSLAYSTGRSGSFEERYAQLEQLKATGKDYTLNRGWNEETLRAKIAEIAADVYVKGQDADVDSFDPDTGKFTFISEVTGYELDTDDLYSQITQAIANGNVTANIEAKVIEVVPEHSVEYMKEHFGRISFAQTETTSNADRNTNIQLAAAEFNGMRVEPGQTVSFNETTGERTASKGYRDAGAYSGGVLVLEPGGGVCQVSTTLYNAVAKADLEIVARSPHSRVSNYVGIGLDAAVNWPSQDFAFKNNTDYPIFIVSSFSDRKLTFKIYGKQMDNGEYIMLESEKTETIPAIDEVTEKYDSTIPAGQQTTEKAREGAKAVSYKVYYNADGKEIGREVLGNSTYPASKTIIRIGTGT